MNMKQLYNRLKYVQELVWTHDDFMPQETLFDLQIELADLLMDVARETGKVDDLLSAFPFIYDGLSDFDITVI